MNDLLHYLAFDTAEMLNEILRDDTYQIVGTLRATISYCCYQALILSKPEALSWDSYPAKKSFLRQKCLS